MPFIKQLFCKHKYKFITGQRIYMTENRYKQKCILCGKTKTWYADVMVISLEEELDKTKQMIYNRKIVNSIPKNCDHLSTDGHPRLEYKGYFLYETESGRWRVKYKSGDSFAINDGYLSDLHAAKVFVDILDYDPN